MINSPCAKFGVSMQSSLSAVLIDPPGARSLLFQTEPVSIILVNFGNLESVQQVE